MRPRGVDMRREYSVLGYIGGLTVWHTGVHIVVFNKVKFYLSLFVDENCVY